MFPTAIAAFLIALSPFSLSSGHLQPGSASIRVTDRLLTTNASDFSRIGGVRVQQFSVYNTGITDKSIGSMVIICTNLGSGKTLGSGQTLCRGILRLPHGSLILGGIAGIRSLFYTLAVLGGTGAYANVGAGDMTSAIFSLGPRRDVLIFQIWAI